MTVRNSPYRKTVLPNGIRVVSERMPFVRSISIGVWITVGSRDENSINNGISHFIEHMLFKGTATYSAADIAESLESVGGHLNAFTSKEQTCYYAHILDEHLSRAIHVISDIIKNSVFDVEEMRKEKRVVLEELNAIEDTPEELIHEMFWEGLFPDHALGQPIIGRRKVIEGMQRDEVVDFVHRHYTGNRIVIAAAGNIQHDELIGLAKEAFSDLGQGKQPQYAAAHMPEAITDVMENGAIQAHVCLGTHAYSYKDNRKFNLLVLNTLLGSGMSSRLFQNIREKHGIAYSIYSFIDFLMDIGVFGVYIGTDRSEIEKAISLIRAELKQLCEIEVDLEELERTKAQLKGNLLLGLEGTSSVMNRLAKMEIYLNDYVHLEDTLAAIEKVNQENLMEAANDLFLKDALYVSVLRPKEAGGAQ